MSMKWIFLGLIFGVAAPAGVVAQDNVAVKPQILINLTQSDGQSGKIEIIQPVQIENLLNLQIANNRLQKGIHGYRICIFSDSRQTARQKMEDTRREFMKTFPELEAHWAYNTPNWQIFVGDFRTKNEALRERKKIEKLYPRASIVTQIIQIPK